MSILPPQKGLEGVLNVKNFIIIKEMYEVQLEFPEGWGVLGKIPSVREVWIIYGTTQYGPKEINNKTTYLKKIKLKPFLSIKI